MEKLIELLNEYEEEEELYEYDNWIINTWYDMQEVWKDLVELEIISKKFWFISRLFENDKIDIYTNLKNNWTFRREFYAIEGRKEYERLIMLLSVEDNPIQYLIDLLKEDDA